jgi:xylulokinase
MKTRAKTNKQISQAPLFLGLDSSTQGLKAMVIDQACAPRFETAVNFDADLPAYKTRGGVHRHADGLTVTSPPLMWVEALDLLLARMIKAKIPLSRIVAVSGSGQQHGSVYLKPGTERILKRLDPGLALKPQLRNVLAVAASPVWMDSSTSRQCHERDAALGGPQAAAEITGSRSYERFTGNQIAKLYRKHPGRYRATERIALVSSFMASLLIGKYAPIDPADGAGMNLMDIRARRWAPRALACTAPGLAGKLGPIKPAHAVVGNISPYYVARYGFAPACKVIAFSGDNPNSLAAMRLEQSGEIAISLGTSDTIFGALSLPRPSATEGHIFGNPINPHGYMALVCYKNGSLTRESVRDEDAGGSWKKFNAILASTPPGNGGKIGFFFKEPEITPPVLKTGIHRFGADDRPVDSFRPAENVRAVVEGQFLSMRLHSNNIGLIPKKILATGGASVNKSLLRIMADVFGAPVYTCRQANSASLGAAYRALHGWQCACLRRFVPFTKVVKPAESFMKACDPDPAKHRLYDALLARYAKLERQVAG